LNRQERKEKEFNKKIAIINLALQAVSIIIAIIALLRGG